jgi:hypothetical protein
MQDHQALGRQTINGMTTRGFLIAPAARRVVLLAVVGLLCSGIWTSPCARGSEGNGQQTGSEDYQKMWKQAFSEQQWLDLLRQRVHQPIAIWKGIETGKIEQKTTSMSFSGLQFESSRSRVLERQIQMNGLMAKHPLTFLPLFEDPDPEIVVTGAAVYQIGLDQGELRPAELNKETADRIAGAIREKLLTHRDVRIRWLAVQMLGQTRWMTPKDMAQAMDDPTLAIRITTVFWAPMVRAQWSWDSDPDNTEAPASGARLTREQFREREALLAEIFLDHLNDNHFYIRERSAEVLRTIFLQRVGDLQAANPTMKPIQMPRNDDWVRNDWGRRAGGQRIWADWWKRNGTPKTP